MIRAFVTFALWSACLSAQAQVLEIDGDGTARRVGSGWDAAIAPSGGVGDASTDAAVPDSIPPRYRDAVRAAASRYELSPWLIDAVARSESGYDADAVSPAGAIGIMQLMPGTARELDVDPRDPTQNILGGAAYLRSMLDRFDGNVDLALAAYNAGGRRVARRGGVPPYRETREYVRGNLEKLAAAADAGAGDVPLPSASFPSPPSAQGGAR